MLAATPGVALGSGLEASVGAIEVVVVAVAIGVGVVVVVGLFVEQATSGSATRQTSTKAMVIFFMMGCTSFRLRAFS